MALSTYRWLQTGAGTVYNRQMSAVIGLKTTVWGAGGSGGGSQSTNYGGGGGGGGAVAIKEYFFISSYREFFSTYIPSLANDLTTFRLQPANTLLAAADYGKAGGSSTAGYTNLTYQDSVWVEDTPAWYRYDNDAALLISIVVDGFAYTQASSLSECKSNEETYYIDTVNKYVYLHMPNGDPPDLWDEILGDWVYHITANYGDSIGAGGSGGKATNSTGDICYDGGDGASGQSLVGGGGGSSAGYESAGNSATGQTGASAPAGGGPGGNGGNQGANGSQPTTGTYGGGGGGGGAKTTTSTTGATGRMGKAETYFYQMMPIMVSYTQGETSPYI